MIHIFSLHGYTLVLDVHSGSVHVVDEDAAALIRLREGRTGEEALRLYLGEHPDADEAQLRQALEQIDQLEQAGKLYSELDMRSIRRQRRQPVLKALCLNVAHSCNLNCSYCFAAQGNYQGGLKLMPYETGRQALDYLIENSGSRRNLEVDFFGGEPLLNWDVVKRLVAYGRAREQDSGKRFRFTLTTNGVLLDDEVMDFCLKEMHNVVLSLDGRPEVHDRFRVDHMGRGSYQTVLPGFQQFVRRRGERGYYIRGTYTRHNLDFLNDILHMADLGFTQLSMEPVVTAPDDPAALREEDLPQIFQQYEQLASEMLKRQEHGKGFDFYHYLIDLEQGPCLHKRLTGCGSGSEYLAVTPSGELYPCHQFITDTAFRLGDVWQGIDNHKARQGFQAMDFLSREDCANCWGKLYCAGGCAANAYHATGSIDGIYRYGCKLFLKRLECALMLQAARSEG